MDLEEKLRAIDGRRESIEHAKFSAELDLAIAEKARDSENAEADPKARLDEAEAQLGILDDAEAKALAEAESK